MLRTLCLAAFFAAIAHAKIIVAVSIAPQAWLVDNIGAGAVETLVMSPPNASAHTYEPKPMQMAKLTKAAAYMACGVEFEKAWLKRFERNAPNMRVFYTDAKIKKLTLSPSSRDANDNQTNRRSGAIDSHIWFSADATRLQAQAIIDALIEVDPANAALYSKNGNDTLNKIDALHSELESKLKPYKDRAFLIHHPALGYFANEYGLRQLFIEFDGKEPKPAELAALIKSAKDANISVVFAERGASPKVASSLAATLGAKVTPITIVSDDWETLMRDAASALIKAFNGGD
ncbi:MAG: zinc ABC transporter substrate-binding protein [Helicobacteraceae bacterium]|jgi:zinc transport system substrate-binding protein|nr:zinc ABC transporter substrate-binding protein [Helicobacteraceae bacterium]